MTRPREQVEARRRFLASCGKFALITPPVMTVLLSSTAQNYAVAGSGGAGGSLPKQGNNGWGNGGSDGVPGKSGSTPSAQQPSISSDTQR